MAKQRPTLRSLEPNREVLMDGQQKVKLVEIDRLETKAIFADLFVMQETVLQEIKKSMQEQGFDMARPIVVNEELVVIEGHTRLQAAKEVGISYLPILVKSFANEEEALYYALREQTARRNLSPQELIQAIHQLEKLYGEGKASAGQGRRLDRLASELGVGASTIAKARYLQKHLPKDPHGKIQEPIKSINASYQELKRQEEATLTLEEAPLESGPSVDASLRLEHDASLGRYRIYHEEELLITLHASSHYDQGAILKLLERKLKL